MIRLYLVRHGETNHNRQRRRHGEGSDPALNATGRRQVAELAARIDFEFDTIFSSPTKRAIETAGIMNQKFGKPLVIREELIERRYGSFSGKTWPEINAALGANHTEMHLKSRFDYRPYGGESPEDIGRRIRIFLDYLKEYHVGERVIAVSHGGIIRMVHQMFSGREVEHIKNASIHEFDL